MDSEDQHVVFNMTANSSASFWKIMKENFSVEQNIENLDYKLHEYPIELPEPSTLEIGVKITIYLILIITALIGNVLVITVVIWDKRMRTTTNYYIVNLAVSDLLVTVSCSWVHLVDSLTEGWILGTFFCKFNSFAQVSSLVCSILSLTLIAGDRFFGIVFSMEAHIIERTARPSLVLIWIFSLCVASPMLFIRKVYKRHWKDHVELWCDGDWPNEYLHTVGNGTDIYHRPLRTAYWIFIAIILFTIPILVMIGAYCGIIRTLWSTKTPGERIANDTSIQTKMKRKVVIMLLLILAVFVVCWFPLQISILYSELRPNQTEMMGEWYDHFSFFARILAFSNSSINPLLYAGFNENFRKGICSMFGCSEKPRWNFSRMDSFRSTTTFSTTITTKM